MWRHLTTLLIINALFVIGTQLNIQGASPLTLEQIEKLIDLNAPDGVIAGEIRADGVAFTTSQDLVETLRQRGAGPQTLQALAAYLVESKLVLVTRPPEADCEVIVDGVHHYRTDSTGRVIITGLQPGEYQIVVKKPPQYLDAERRVTVQRGEKEFEIVLQPTMGQQEDDVFWNSIKDSKDLTLFQLYLSRFPNGAFVDSARRRAAEMEAERAKSRGVATVYIYWIDAGIVVNVIETLLLPLRPLLLFTNPKLLTKSLMQTLLIVNGQPTVEYRDGYRFILKLEPGETIFQEGFLSSDGKDGITQTLLFCNLEGCKTYYLKYALGLTYKLEIVSSYVCEKHFNEQK